MAQHLGDFPTYEQMELLNRLLGAIFLLKVYEAEPKYSEDYVTSSDSLPAANYVVRKAVNEYKAHFGS